MGSAARFRPTLLVRSLNMPAGGARSSFGAVAGGFTLVELVVVLMIVGVLAVAAIPRFMDQSVFETRGFHDETMSLLRYAQKAAIAQHRAVCVALNATGVTMTIASAVPPSTACNTPLAFPSAPRGGTGLSSSVASFMFLGSGFSTSNKGTDQAANVTVTFSDGSGITVDAVTGYVY